MEILRERSVRVSPPGTRTFTLASGATSDLYIDARATTLHASGAALAARLLLERLRADVVAIGGLTLGADPLACAAAAHSLGVLGRPVHAFLVRKEAKAHGTGQRIEGLTNLEGGDPVCVVEDTTTTGGSLLKAVDAAVEAGLKVVQCVTLVDREEGAGAALAARGYTLEAITTRTELLLG